MADVTAAPLSPLPPLSPQRDQILICGLGSLGQHCVANLKTFGVRVTAINAAMPERWEIGDLPQMIDHLVIGDCRAAEVLQKANIHACRAALLVTADERINLEAALSARVLNPDIRLVVRSEKQNLNDLLEQELANFIAFEPTQLAAPAFALEALDQEMIGFFKVGEQSFRVVRRRIQPHDGWCDSRKVYEVIHRDRRVLRYLTAQESDLPLEELAQRSPYSYSASAQFHTWLPDAIIRAGDVIVTVEAETGETAMGDYAARPVRPGLLQRWRRGLAHWREWRWQGAIAAFWQTGDKHQIRRVAALCGLTIIALCLVGSGLMVINGVTPSFADAFYATVVLLLGGYGDVFGGLALDAPIPPWLRFFSLCLTLAGTAFIGVLYALLTEKLLTLRFEFLTKRPPVPERGHVVVIWLGRVGRQVVEMLQDLKQPVVGITSQPLEPDILPQTPLVSGPIRDALEKANIATAKSVVTVGDDE
ncbi:MAG TPA: NAD-binding protein, partial [Candidatus Obscuribacterales bacterium]